MRRLWQQRVVDPVLELLRQGLTVEKITHSLVAGAVISIFPIWGTTVTLSVIAIFVFRLNVVAVMAANFLAYPLQILMFIPYCYLGQKIFGGELAQDFSLKAIEAKAGEGWLLMLQSFGDILWKAALAWGISAPLWILGFYFMFRPLVVAMQQRLGIH